MKTTNKTRFMVQLALLIAIQLLLSLTSLGYIRLSIMEITIMHLPVLVGAIVLGPMAGAILGTVFGLTSLYAAITTPTITAWPFSPMLTGSAYSVVIAMVPRILLGVIAAYLFRWLSGRLNHKVAAGISAAAGAMCNTILVLSGIYFLFGERYAAEMSREGGITITQEMIRASFLTVAGTNGVVEAILAVVLCAALVTPLRRLIKS